MDNSTPAQDLRSALENARGRLKDAAKMIASHGDVRAVKVDEWSDEARRALAAPATDEPVAFQQRVQPWLMQCFGAEISGDMLERADRFTEEALELAQTMPGFTAARAHALVDYVFGRDVGERQQEVGGVMVTLAALCLAADIDMHEAGEVELARIIQPHIVEKIRAKQAAKPTGSALPVANPPAAEPVGLREADADALNGYRAAVSWISADSWDGCSDCIAILRKARTADWQWDWAGDPQRIALELKALHDRLGEAALATPALTDDAAQVGGDAAPLADIIAWLEVIRDVVREAYFAADDSEDRSCEEPPIHCVPHSNFVDLCNALHAAEAFAREGELWNGPGPLVTRIIDILSTQAAYPTGAGEGWRKHYYAMAKAAGDLKAAVRPQLDAMTFADHVEVRKAFNDIAIVAGRALDYQQSRPAIRSLSDDGEGGNGSHA